MDKKDKFYGIFRDVYGEDIKHNENLFKLGFDSLMMTQAVGQIFEVFPEEIEQSFQELLEFSLNNPYIDNIYMESFSKKNNTKEDFILNEREKEHQDIDTQHYILYTQDKKYEDIIEKIKNNINVRMIDKEDLKSLENTNIKSLISFGDNCNEVIEIAKKYSLNNNPITKVILVDPQVKLSSEIYLGEVNIISNTVKNDDLEELVNKKIEKYSKNTFQLIERLLTSE